MRIIDISLPLSSDLVTYKNKEEKKFQIQFAKSKGENYVFESSIALNSHTGTHADAPLHFIKNGKTINQTALEPFVGPCQLIDTGTAEVVTREVLQERVKSERVLLQTKNRYSGSFNPDFVYLDASGAEYLVEQGVKLVGIDYLGIERDQPDHPTHKTLMSANIAILEGLDLQALKEGNYFLIALPLNVQDAEAAPVRAVLVEGLR